MKTLFKDEVVAKFRKMPSFLWYFILAASYFFKNAYVTLGDAKIMTESYAEQFAELGVTGFNGTAFTVVVAILVPVIYTVIFELFARIIYGLLVRRFALAVNQNDFCFRLRLVIIVANIILGAVGIFYFFFPEVIDILSAIFGYAVPTLLIAWFYEDFRVRYVPKRNHASLFLFAARIYVGIYLALSVFDLVYYLALFDRSLTVLETVSVCLDTVIVASSALLAYLNHRRLQKISREPEDNDLFIKKEEKPKDDSIFKDFGF